MSAICEVWGVLATARMNGYSWFYAYNIILMMLRLQYLRYDVMSAICEVLGFGIFMMSHLRCDAMPTCYACNIWGMRCASNWYCTDMLCGVLATELILYALILYAWLAAAPIRRNTCCAYSNCSDVVGIWHVVRIWHAYDMVWHVMSDVVGIWHVVRIWHAYDTHMTLCCRHMTRIWHAYDTHMTCYKWCCRHMTCYEWCCRYMTCCTHMTRIWHGMSIATALIL